MYITLLRRRCQVKSNFGYCPNLRSKGRAGPGYFSYLSNQKQAQAVGYNSKGHFAKHFKSDLALRYPNTKGKRSSVTAVML